MPTVCLRPKAHHDFIGTVAFRAHSNPLLFTKLHKIFIISLNSGTFSGRMALLRPRRPWPLAVPAPRVHAEQLPLHAHVQTPGFAAFHRAAVTAGLTLPFAEAQ